MRRFSAGLRDRLLVGVVLCAVLAVVVVLNPQAYVSRFNLFENIFKDLNESILIQFRDGDVFIYTSSEVGRAAVDPARIIEDLTKTKGKKISDIIQITHNHFSGRTFTEADNDFLHYFEAYGFAGDFNIYYTESKKVETKKASVRRN